MHSKHPMTSKQWLLAFLGTVAGLVLLLAAFNYVTDPFGAFGDRFFQWWSYDETMNPRVAKISYLEQNHEKYDSYIIGCSSTSSYPTEQLNEYFNANFYNLIMYGADLYDVELMSKYVLENYEVKNLVVNLYIHNAETYQTEPDSKTYNLHYKVDDSSPLAFFAKYLFANPQYGVTKLKNYLNDGYLQKSYDVFNEETGAYDKSLRDVQSIGALDSYLAQPAYAAFLDYPQQDGSIPYLEECMSSVRAIKELCEEQGVEVTFVCPPMYYENLNYYSFDEIETFNRSLAEITDYWDFTLSSVSYEPRYFYDETHFRNCVGEMAVARMFGDDSVYIPKDFGYYVTADTVDGLLESYEAAQPMEQEQYTARVPILMYHHLSEGEGSGDTISAAVFESHMEALGEAGYTAVTFEELRAYVETDAQLPEKPVVITFDDGYESNLTLAAPILEKYGMQATVFAIGVSAGKDTYKDTGAAMIPHFALEDALEYGEVITVQSHGYNIHEVEGRDQAPIRQGVLAREDESEEEYIQFLRNDCQTMNELFQEAYGESVGVVAYPYGLYSDLSEVILSEYEVYATVTSEPKTNTIVKGIPQSLRAMGRYTVYGETSAQELLAMLESE